jgi:hypothetical protein
MPKRYNIVDPKTLKRVVGKLRNYLDRGVGAITAAPPLNGPLRPASYLRNWRIAFSVGVSGGWIERGCPDGSTAGAGFGTSCASANDEPANTKVIAASPKDFMTPIARAASWCESVAKVHGFRRGSSVETH